MAGRATYNVHLGEEWRRTALALRHVDRELPGQLRKAMRDAAKPAAEDAKRRVKSLPVHGRKHSGLRRRVASGVTIQAGAGRGLGVRIVTNMRDPQERNLPRYLDDPRGWRHPVFGNRHEWVQQHTGGSWFRATIAEHRPEMVRELEHVLGEAAETIAAATRG
ncbi:hypothetical protein DMA15_03510 [Streptomyces sp. WAC 01529]|uniref:hypothetical protein n=1 Tax=Streptomyces sp. WAC 01529 TaxID=2203205 RepID=UPI000F6E122A|nr:hypothetical protein [Streptomyces sp. WAC 01529]AZM51760.1 hypothetical protein DMA15_03510 [Streptomyces sp. WAC 01529]